MIIPAPVQQWHSELAAPCVALRGLVRSILLPYCDRQGYTFRDRIKTAASVAEKIETGRFASFDAIDDLYAATIVIPSLADDATVVAYLESQFDATGPTRGRGRTSKSPDVFRFDATRYYGRMRVTPEDRDKRVDQMIFEVQVQTAFEHAWVSVTHDRTYKSASGGWRTHRLAASMKAAVEQLDLLLVGFEQSAQLIEPSTWDHSLARDSVLTLLSDLAADKSIPEETLPAAPSRFADNLCTVCDQEARRRRERDKLVVVKEATECLAKALRAHTPPKSLSLFQSSLGLLAEEKVLRPTLTGLHLPITQDAIDLYPKLAKLCDNPFEFGGR